MELQPKHTLAPPLYGNRWINSDPIALNDMLGQVIIVDFWDYTSLACVRSVPYLRHWQQRYRDFGLIVVGVHTPQFQFARDFDLVENAIRGLEITYPVVVDNDALVWNAYGNRYWPTRYLIDKDGYVRFVEHGEGGYQNFERALQQLLIEAGYRGQLPPLMEPIRDTDLPGVMSYRATGEIFVGYLRGALGNPEGYSPESTIDYVDPALYLPERFYAQGKWMNERECMRFEGSSLERGAITLFYEALEVNAVLGSKNRTHCVVTVEQDFQSVTAGLGGEQIIRQGTSAIVHVDTPKLYSLVRNKEFGTHHLRLLTSSPQLEIYSFSFVSTVIPEYVSKN